MYLHFSLEVFFKLETTVRLYVYQCDDERYDVKIIILDTVYHLLSINLHVVAVVSNQGSIFKKPLIC